MEEREYPRPLSAFDMKEIYRIIHNESIPGFVLLRSEREYIEEYREALKRLMAEEKNEIQATSNEVKTNVQKKNKRRSTRRKKQNKEERIEDNFEKENNEEVIES